MISWDSLNTQKYYEKIHEIISSRGQWSDDIRFSKEGCSRHHIKCAAFGFGPETLDWSHNDNIIWLTHYEHLIVHKILAYDNMTNTLACSGYIMFRKFCTQRHLNVDEIDDEEMFNKIYHIAQSRPGELNGMFGRTHSKDSILKILEHRDYSVFHSKEFKEKCSLRCKESRWYTDGINESFTTNPPEGWHEGSKPGTNCGGKNASAIKCYVYDENKNLLDICECINYAGLKYGLKNREAKGHTGWEKGPYKGYYFIKESEVM